MPGTNRARRWGGLATAMLGALVVAAAAWSATTGSPGVAKAKAALAPSLKQATSIGVATPLSKTPPKGKKIYFLQCSQPVCTAFLGGMKAATAALGWSVAGHSFTQTPEGI